MSAKHLHLKEFQVGLCQWASFRLSAIESQNWYVLNSTTQFSQLVVSTITLSFCPSSCLPCRNSTYLLPWLIYLCSDRLLSSISMLIKTRLHFPIKQWSFDWLESTWIDLKKSISLRKTNKKSMYNHWLPRVQKIGDTFIPLCNAAIT